LIEGGRDNLRRFLRLGVRSLDGVGRVDL